MGAEVNGKNKDDTLPRLLVRSARALRGRQKLNAAKVAYLLATALDPSDYLARRELNMMKHRPEGVPAQLRFIGLGTTGLCNASCVHCPTGKLSTSMVPRNPMPMALYKSIIDNLFDHGISVRDQVSFGLFGDGLVDPFVQERAEYLRKKLPDVFLSINTNGAAFNAKKHAALNMDNMVIALHCESLEEETYNYLMQPLRFERVFPKYEEILEAFPGKVLVSVPVSRANFKELRAIREWFLIRGAERVVFDPMSSRCVEDRTVFNALSLAPGPIACRSDVLSDLIVDCDGAVLMCCQDFSREEPIGNIAHQGFLEIFRTARRKQVQELLDNDGHAEFSTCSKCFADYRTEDFPFGHEASVREAGPCARPEAVA